MNIRPIAAADIPAVLPLVEQYWIFEDIAGYDGSRIGRELLGLCDDPRLGAGSALLAAVEAESTRRECRNISLQLGRGNEAAREFYRRQGYSERSGFELLDKMLPQ